MNRKLLTTLLIFFSLTIANKGMAQESAYFEPYRLPDISVVDIERAEYVPVYQKSLDVIESEQIKLKAERNPVKLLQESNSSVVFGGGLRGATVTPSYRGFAPRYTLVTLDGTLVNTPWNGTSLISGFPLARLKQVKTVSPGFALAYGPGSSGGAVNMVLPSGKDLEGGTLALEGGSDSKKYFELMYGMSDDEQEHLWGIFKDEDEGKRKFADFVNAATLPVAGLGEVDNRKDSTAIFYKGSLKLRDDLKLHSLILHNEGSITCPQYFERFDPWRMRLFGMGLEKQMGNSASLQLRYTAYQDFTRTSAYAFGDNSLSNPTKTDDSPTRVNMDTFEILYNLKSTDRYHWTFGAMKQETKDVGHSFANAAGTGIIREKSVDNKGFFVNNLINLSEDFDLNLSYRSDEDYEGSMHSSWAAGGLYRISDSFRVAGSISEIAKNPNMQEMYRIRMSGNTIRARGNPDLDSETSKNVELTLEYDISNKTVLTLTYFNADIDDMIAWRNDPGLGFDTAVNLEKTKFSGLEFSAVSQLKDNLKAWISFTEFSKADDVSPGIASYRLPDRPENRAVLGTAYECGKNSFMLSAMYQGKIKATNDGATAYPEVDSSFSLNLNLRHQVSDNLAFYIGAENLLDDDDIILNQTSGIGAAQGAGINLNRSNPMYYQPGRQITFGTEYKF
ncbi:MAG: TonB-dependent receptor [Candidatus Riflebacteria bacterium]|nr:TonB-dependent receptor [Candidatus Riflebacteria bacterium]